MSHPRRVAVIAGLVAAAWLSAACATREAAPAAPRLELDPARSTIRFVSVKNDALAETHVFRRLAGDVDASGNAEVVIDLLSVDTAIPIRDERMREMLFETTRFAEATVRIGGLDLAPLQALPVGQSATVDAMLAVSLHGVDATLPADFEVTRLAEGRWRVDSGRPVLVTAAAFGLDVGIERLREVAGLNRITPVVPVLVRLEFISGAD